MSSPMTPSGEFWNRCASSACATSSSTASSSGCSPPAARDRTPRTCCATSSATGARRRHELDPSALLPDRQLRGRQSAGRPGGPRRGRRRPTGERDHARAPRLPGMRRGTRRALCARRRAARRRRRCRRGERDRMPRGVLHAVSRDGLAAALAALAVRQRARGRLGHRRGAARPGQRPHPGDRPGRRRRDRRHRDGVPVGHVRARRRRALHLLRQPGLHEHRRAALRSDPATGDHDHHPGGRRASRSALGTGKERADDRARPRDPLRRDGDDRGSAGSRGQGGARDEHPRPALRASARHLPLGVGLRGRGHDPRRPPGDRERALPRLRGRVRRGHRRHTDSPSGSGRGVPANPAAFQPPVRAPPTRRRDRAAAGSRRPHDQTAGAAVSDLPFAITLTVGSSAANHTGSWRTDRPVYVHREAPCGSACPSGEDVRGWLFDAEAGDYEAAWRRIVDANPFPATMGRICYHPCETACNRGQLDEAVGINSVERFLGDEAIARGWSLPGAAEPSGRRVLVIGAGPCGLGAAYQLARLGHAVTVRDGAPQPGGMMRYGIPRYRLPRDVLDAEIARIIALGVEIECGRTVNDAAAAMRADGFDAVLLAVGARLAHRTDIPAGSAAHMLDAISLLHDVADQDPPQLGRRVVVYGGGDTAVDAARTARRLGAEEPVIVYRRTRERMPAHESELREAAAEGVLTKWLSTIHSVDSGGVTIERMKLDDSGTPQPTGELETLAADSVILALGQDTDLRLLGHLDGVEVDDGVVSVARSRMTGHPGIFAGGDATPGERTATRAIGDGAAAAQHIDAWLRGGELPTPAPQSPAGFDQLNPWYYSDAPRSVRPTLEAARRSSTFDEIVGGLDADTALFEARRCLSCGSCLACDNCYGVCPDNAVIKLEPAGPYAYEFDLDYCKGCGLCAQECPCGAIEMRPEQI